MSITLYSILNYMNWRILDWRLFICLFFFCHVSLAAPSKDIRQLRRLYLQIESEIKKENYHRYHQYQTTLKQYPLYPYLQYQYMKKNIATISGETLETFISSYPTFPYNVHLRHLWLKKRADLDQWSDFLIHFQDTKDIELQCHQIQAHLNMHGNEDILELVKPIWLYGHSRPKACDQVFDSWEASGKMSRAMIWQRIKLAIDANNPKLALYLAAKLRDNERELVDLWLSVNQNPYLIRKKKMFSSKHAAMTEMVVHGLKLIAQKEPEKAIHLWQTIARRHQLNERHWGDIVHAIALAMARQNKPHAEKWLKKIPKMNLDQAAYIAQLREALATQNWTWLVEITNQLPLDFAKEENWQYWRAKALAANGQHNASQQIMQDLSQNRSYYGFLASVESNQPFSFRNEPLTISFEDIGNVASMPGIVRAREFLKIDRSRQASLEWHTTLKNLNEVERQAAAKLANRWKQHNWSIRALAKANHKDDLHLRFPKAHAHLILKEARRTGIDPAWIFAVTRQESAFVADARSRAGALGLMQVMPSTARMVAKQAKMPLQYSSELFDAEKNIRLGSLYLKMMLEQYQKNPVLATAAYNAGPGRVRQWLPQQNMPADHWIEIIPYKETRSYVQNVLTYTLIYQQLLGQTPVLLPQMPLVLGNTEKRK